MRIQIDEQTKSWLESKKKSLTIKTLQVNGCCAPPIQEVTTTLGKPKDNQRYTEIQLDGLSIFVEKSLTCHEQLTLKLTGFGLFKMVSARLTCEDE